MYQLAAYLHLLAAITWLGGAIFLGVILVPLTRRIQEPPGAGARILGASARRFRLLGWGALSVMVGTGIWMALLKGVGVSEVVTSQGWFIQTLRIKLAIVALMLALSALHDFVIGPRLARRLEALRGPPSGDPYVLRQRKMVSWLARINLMLALVIVALGVLLVRGNPV